MAKLPSAADLLGGRPSIVAPGAPSAARVPEAPKISTGTATVYGVAPGLA